jgi:3-phosphoshikimate 1-carboxyvinyltransferase
MILSGVFSPPGDKSISHRIALLSLLADGKCSVSNFSTARDCMTSVNAIRQLDVNAVFTDGRLELTGANRSLKSLTGIDCQNSGTTMRLLMGILAGVSGQSTLWGDESLMKRPMERIAVPLRMMGSRIECAHSGTPPVNITGSGLSGIDFEMPVASAQLKSAVLLAGIQAKGSTRIKEPVKSRDHTERMLKLLGADISFDSGVWTVKESELKLPETFEVPGDPSSAAFFICGAVMLPGSEILCERVLLNGTRATFLQKLREMGANVEIEHKGDHPEPWGHITASYSEKLAPCLVKADQLPVLIDEVPILTLLATQAHGVSVFEEIGELRIKESDRISALISELGKMGARIDLDGDNLLIHGPTTLRHSNTLNSFGDHRIAMTLAIGTALANLNGYQESRIKDLDCVGISYPDFFDVMKDLSA